MRIDKEQEKIVFNTVRENLLVDDITVRTEYMYHRSFIDCRYTVLDTSKFELHLYRGVDFLRFTVTPKNSVYSYDIQFNPLRAIRLASLVKRKLKEDRKKLQQLLNKNKTIDLSFLEPRKVSLDYEDIDKIEVIPALGDWR